MRILGIDPGTAITGFAILEKNKNQLSLLKYGCIYTESGLEMASRLNKIATELQEIIKSWSPTHAAIEKIFFSKNVKTAMTVMQSRGVVMEKLFENGILPAEYTPVEIKNSVCGYGKADKKMVQKMIKMIFGLKEIPKPDDAADAVAAAVCLANSIALTSRIK